MTNMFTVCTNYYNLLSAQLLIVSVNVIAVIAKLLSCVVMYSVVVSLLVIMFLLLDATFVLVGTIREECIRKNSKVKDDVTVGDKSILEDTLTVAINSVIYDIIIMTYLSCILMV